MKKVVGSLILICVMFANLSFAAYEDEIDPISADYDIELINDESGTEIQPRNYDDSSIVYDDVYRLDNDITITGMIDGNVFLLGKHVKVDSATIYGDLYVLAETIEITDTDIGSSAYLMGKNITFSGMTNDVYLFGADVKLDENTSIWRNVRAVAEDLEISGYITRNVFATAKNLNVLDNAMIEGALHYASKQEATIAESAQIADVQYSVITEHENQPEKQENVIGAYAYQFGSSIVKTLIIALFVVFLVKKFRNLQRTENIANDLLKQFGKGAAVLVVVPMIAVLLMVTVVGLVLGISLVAIYVVLLCIATSIASIEIAYRIVSRNAENEITNKKLIGMSVLVSAVISLISFIPVIGAFVKMVLVLIGLGVVFDLMFQKTENK